MSAAILLHGGSPARRTALAQVVRDTLLNRHHLEVRIRVSSRAAEAAKCLADPAVIAVFLVDDPTDAEAVRAASAALGVTRRVYAMEPRDDAEVVVSLVRDAISYRP